MNEALNHATTWKIKLEQVDAMSKATKPDKFTNETQWPLFSLAFKNYLSTIIGVFGIPLSYIIRDVDSPVDGEEYNSWTQQAVAWAPLTGADFTSDAQKVHQLLKSHIQGQPAQRWIKNLKGHQDGRCNWIALKQHYAGEGNVLHCIAEAEKLKTTLQYKH